MAITSLNSAKLYRTAALKKLTVSSTKHLTPLDEIVGQARARQAVEFAMAIKDKGYNIYALGQNGLGKRTMIMRYLNQHWHPDNTLYDWCYVANFDEARQPKVLKLPQAKAKASKKILKNSWEICAKRWQWHSIATCIILALTWSRQSLKIYKKRLLKNLA